MKRLENQIIEYVSGEMNNIDRIAFDKMMEADPDIQAQVAELQSTQLKLGSWEDESIEIPHFELPKVEVNTTSTKVFQMKRLSPWVKYASSAAAVIAMLWMSGLQINTSGNSLTLSFGAPEVQSDIDDKIDTAVNKALEKYDRNQNAQLAQFSEQISSELNTIKTSVSSTSTNWNQEKAAVKKMINQLSESQYAQLESMLNNYNANQEVRLNASFADLMEYIDDKRIDDLSQIQGAFSHLVAAMDAQQERTDELFQGLVQPVAASIDY